MTPAGLYDLALTCHLLGAFSLVSGTVMAAVSSEIARRRANSAEIALLLGLALTGAVLIVGGMLVAVGFGLWLVDLGNWGYGTPWVDASIGLLALVAVIGAIDGQRPRKARKIAVRLAGQDLPPNTELAALLRNRLAIGLNYAAGTMLLAIIVLMVVKPGSPPQ